MSNQMTLWETTVVSKGLSARRKVYQHLEQYRTISPQEALGCYGIMRLAPRILELRCDGHVITTTMLKTTEGKPYARYRLHSPIV